MADDMESVGDVGEFKLIDRLNALLGPQHLIAGIGDDAAIIGQPGSEVLLATIDMQVQDVHFRLGEIEPFDLGRRALAVNLSDIAAMGGEPTVALISLALPAHLPASFVEDMYRGLGSQAATFGVAIAGGNISRISGPLAIDIALLGRAAESRVVRRSGARPGDILAVTGALGAAAAGRRLLNLADGPPEGFDWDWVRTIAIPRPRINEGIYLAGTGCITAMIDISDGFAADLHHLCRASGVGACIDTAQLPVDDRALRAAQLLGAEALEFALFGGEDYELLCSLSPRDWEMIRGGLQDTAFHQIGIVLEPEEGIVMRRSDGRMEALSSGGWKHF